VVVALQNYTVHAPYEHNAPYKAVRRKCPLAIPVPRGPYRLGAHAPGRPRGRAPRRPDRLRLLTDIDHRRPCRRLGSESDNGDQNPMFHAMERLLHTHLRTLPTPLRPVPIPFRM